MLRQIVGPCNVFTPQLGDRVIIPRRTRDMEQVQHTVLKYPIMFRKSHKTFFDLLQLIFLI